MSADIYVARPWLALYAPDRPADIAPDFGDMLSAFRASLARAPDASFLHYFDAALTLSQLDAASDRLAGALQARGFGPGDRLALYVQNNPAFVIGLLAAWKLGGMGVCINPMNKARELAHLLADSGACALLCLDTLYAEVAREVVAGREETVRTVITTSALDGQARGDTRVLEPGVRLPVPEGVLDLRSLMEAPASLPPLPGHRPRPADVALLTYTSGTTGLPKGAMNTHGNLAFNAQTYRDWAGLTPEDCILGIAPLFHITGVVAHVALALLTGCRLVLHHRFHPQTVLEMMRLHRPSFTIGAITAFIGLMSAEGARREDFSSFRAIFSGGAPISPATSEAFETFSGHCVHNAYGMTETSSPSHLVPLGRRAPVDPDSGALSVGVPVVNTIAWALREDGQPAAHREVGEIAVRGPQVVPGYWRQSEATAAALPDGRLRTGDVGFMDEQGWFYLVDRKKDMINAGGYKVWPREVEDILCGHPAVREAAVIGVPDGYRGETVKAVVSLKPGTQAGGDELARYCKDRMAAYKYPRLVEIVDELPKTATGKILRRSLR